ncbi:MAG: transporter substrate-binding domain-containing protein [Halobacteriovoraceae bacterium]|jgi:two-component system, NarL family, sensor histidine kinase EvgS|nr:transporter substrate-binding domain-containing protein [Halobacteriovoraceae bacterium]MBT5092741.1 transporter substrate-binding domain-containing protein [Halobacteriovoraceae bacterium]
MAKFVFVLFILFSIQSHSDVKANSEDQKLQLSELEREWIKKNPMVDFTGDPNWLPFEAFDKNGQYIGIVADHLEIIEKVSGLKLNKIVTQSWTESTNKAKNKKVSILSETDDSALKTHLNFTNSYISNPIVIAMRHENNYTENIDKIKNKRVALIKDYGYATKIRKKYSHINFITVDDINDGLTSVSTGKVDALLCTLALCSYTIAQMGISNVKITGETEFDTKLAFGIQKDLPELLSIFNKSIKHITKMQQQNILQKWISPKQEMIVDYTFAYQILAGAVFFILFVLFWNRRLSKEVVARIKVEEVLEEKQHQLEGLLQGQRETIKLLFNNSPFGFAFCDMSGLMIDINTEFSRITGYNIDELKKVTYWNLTPEKYKGDGEQQLRSLEENGAYGPYRKEYIKKDGTVVPVELNGFIIENYNGVKGIFSLVEDISEKIARDQEIEIQRKKLIHSAKLASIGEMAAGVGHEINNPLAIATLNVNLINRFLKSKEFVSEDMKRYLSCITYANERMQKIVAGLKLYSRLDTSVYTRVSITEAILETLALSLEIYEKDGIAINFDKGTESLFTNGSLGELQQILINLLSNAKDATEGMSNRVILIELIKKGDYAYLSVNDNGTGIRNDVKEHIFDPFFTTKDPGKGTGLGLGLVYELVKKMDGEVSVNSVLGKGSTFIISLPILSELESLSSSPS